MKMDFNKYDGSDYWSRFNAPTDAFVKDLPNCDAPRARFFIPASPPTDADRTVGLTVVFSLAIGAIVSVVVISYVAAGLILGAPLFE